MVGLINHVIDEVLVGAVDGIHDVGVGSVLRYFGEGPICFTLSSPRNYVDFQGVKRLCLMSKRTFIIILKYKYKQTVATHRILDPARSV